MSGLMVERHVAAYPSLVRAIGPRDAILLQQVFWLSLGSGGVHEATRAELAETTGLSRDQVNRSIAALIEKGLLVAFELDDGNPGMSKQVYEVDQNAVTKLVANTGFAKPQSRVAIPPPSCGDSAKPSSLRDTNRDKTPSVATEVATVEEPTQSMIEAEALCERLADLVAEATEMKRKPVTKTWIVDMERMIRIDDVSAERIDRMLTWLFTNPCTDAEFWRGNILSPSKLRKKFPNLVVIANKNRAVATTGGPSKQEKTFGRIQEVLAADRRQLFPSQKAIPSS